MARLTKGVTYEQIRRISDWHLHEDALRGALADITDGIAGLDAAKIWGEGKSSSSDGQRFIFPRKTVKRTYSHRLSDYALEFYSFIADNCAPFYSRPIECNERDAAYVLDGLLYHESELAPEEHYTDTHGYTECNFAAFAMLGRRFCPRIRGLKNQRIYHADSDLDYGPLADMLSGPRRGFAWRGSRRTGTRLPGLSAPSPTYTRPRRSSCNAWWDSGRKTTSTARCASWDASSRRSLS